MQSLFICFTATLAISSFATAHLALLYPPQFLVPWNPKAVSIDTENRSPLFPSGSNYPCMNGHKGMTEASSVATWKAGSTQEMTLEGTTFHNGGSCQISLSYDKGKTFRVIHSYIGHCPDGSGSGIPFKIPSDAPSGLALFSWSWINNTGNREFYHKCAAVTIERGGGKVSTPFSKRPSMFIANMDATSCKSIEGMDPIYPNPGPDVTGSTKGPTGLVGNCGSVINISGSSTDNSTAQDDGHHVSDLRPGTASAFPLTGDGSCGAKVGKSCRAGSCCSKWGWCGFFDGHCSPKAECQADYGQSSSGSADGNSAKKSAGRNAITRPYGALKQVFIGVVPGMVRVEIARA